MFDNKSLLSILKEEESVLGQIERAERTVKLYQKEVERVKNIPIECGVKNADIEFCVSLVEEYSADADEYKNRLREVRKELFEYFNELQDKYVCRVSERGVKAI